MCGIYCVYKQSRSCQLPFCASPIFHFEIGDFSVYLYCKCLCTTHIITGYGSTLYIGIAMAFCILPIH